MTGRFQYMPEVSKLGEIVIDNIGDCCLSCGDDLGNVFYLSIKTSDVGLVHTIEFGPLTREGKINGGCFCQYNSFPYSESAIRKQISTFMNRRNTLITYVDSIDIDAIKEKEVDIPAYFHQQIGF